MAEQQAQEERASESGYNAPVPDKTADVQNEKSTEKPAEKGCQSAVGIAPLLALILSGIYVAENKKRNR